MKVTLDMEEEEPIILSKDDGWKFVPGNTGLVATKQRSDYIKSMFIIVYLSQNVAEYLMNVKSGEMVDWIDHKRYRKITHE